MHLELSPNRKILFNAWNEVSGYDRGYQGLRLLPDAAGIFEVSLWLDPFRPKSLRALISLILDVFFTEKFR